jgi:asparaginyl-tRNA synthetase
VSPKELTFLEINDGSSLKGLQIVVNQDLPDYENIVKQDRYGGFSQNHWQASRSPAKGQRIEMQAEKLPSLVLRMLSNIHCKRSATHLNSCARSPICVPALIRWGQCFGCVMPVPMRSIAFFRSAAFIWVHTPIITASDCEGAGEMFAVTAMDLANVARVAPDPKSAAKSPRANQPVDFSQDFFGKPTFLTVSGQLEAEIMAMAFSNVYTFGPTFRAENSNTSRHLAEFWMIEPEMAFCDLEGDADLAEEFLKYIFSYVLETCPEDMEFFQKRISDQRTQTMPIKLSTKNLNGLAIPRRSKF